MARVTTKVDLITSANGQFEKMWKLIDSMTEEQQTAIFAEKMVTMGKEAHWSRDKNLRDVLVHLYEWHQLLLNWISSNRAGERKPFLPEPYNLENISGNERGVLEETPRHIAIRRKGNIKRKSSTSNGIDCNFL